jgi:hypothetical protein
MIVRRLLLKRFIFGIAGVGIPSQRDFFDQSPPFRSYMLRLGTGMSSFYKYSFTKWETDEKEHASTIQKGKMERTSALFVDSACLALWKA